ncbi:5-(carboxyamino)imidazole ribonucleotide synthase [Halorarum salinum]|uniref:N5-carboxyaminoimidazole ribonucleotide synthase n=1 Tax=Halorarum salinum TaxID=2743089 RepID=A0A7D5L9V6_9EURY|nr:5-(carboxyamino)imidazole ribonucleotide synthase [Halobaculum salinum]QLG61613.1 5-(carboxyamino)imidazole ribonucleotide synthase [Halobaculum salinum]
MTPTCPGPTLGVVGGGQLGRMLAEAASPLGVDVVVLDPTPDCPAARVAEQVEGAFDDPDAVRALAERADALTLEIELADPDVLESASAEYDVPVHPSPDALRTIRDKLVQNGAFADAGVPVPEFVRVDGADDLADAVEALPGSAAMLKARTGGYDGRGNRPVEAGDDYGAALAEVGAGDGGALAEELVDFEREVAVIGVRGDDEVRAFPLTETVHEAEIMRETVVPARTSDAVAKRAREVALDALDTLDGRGVFGIELFETSEGEVLLNEVAPRPHNSGHWTIEGATASQFEQHVRAVLGWPLAPAEARAPTVTANVLGDVSDPEPARLRGVGGALSTPNAHFHWYGKREVRPLRKMGHVTLTRADADENDLLAEARGLRDELTFTTDDHDPR